MYAPVLFTDLTNVCIRSVASLITRFGCRRSTATHHSPLRRASSSDLRDKRGTLLSLNPQRSRSVRWHGGVDADCFLGSNIYAHVTTATIKRQIIARLRSSIRDMTTAERLLKPAVVTVLAYGSGTRPAASVALATSVCRCCCFSSSGTIRWVPLSIAAAWT